jgi:hypothetical protein
LIRGQVSVAAGAVLAGASPEEVKACEKYAVDIGLAFQGTKAFAYISTTILPMSLASTRARSFTDDQALELHTYAFIIPHSAHE